MNMPVASAVSAASSPRPVRNAGDRFEHTRRACQDKATRSPDESEQPEAPAQPSRELDGDGCVSRQKEAEASPKEADGQHGAMHESAGEQICSARRVGRWRLVAKRQSQIDDENQERRDKRERESKTHCSHGHSRVSEA